MASVILLGICLVLFFYSVFKYATFRPPNFPPGPPRVPIFGGYLFMLLINSKHLHKAAILFSKIYKSKIIGFYIGNTPTVVANDYESVKEMLFRREFDGRNDIFAARMRDPHHNLKGIFFIDGLGWRDQRRFILRNLRDWGFGRRSEQLEIEIRDEIFSFIELLKEGPKFPHEEKLFRGEGTVLCPDIFFAGLSNAFLKILCGERIPRKDQEILFKTGEDGMKFQKYNDDYGKLFSVIPWIRHLFPTLCGYKPIKEGNEGVYNFIKTIVDKEIQTYDEHSERHVIDLFITKMREAEQNNKEDTLFLYDQLVMSCTDFFFPALTAVGQQLTFLFQRIFLYPEVQTKIQKEIDEIVGHGRLPTLDDRINLAYTEASIREILRHETLVPSSIPHRAMAPSTYFGYDIPKDSFLIPGLYAFHNDKDLWGDPENFRPERFIGENGKLQLSKDKSFPFGAGKRLCAGETFARNALFLFVSGLLQNFNVILPPGAKKPKLEDNQTGLITFTPDNFYVKFVPR